MKKSALDGIKNKTYWYDPTECEDGTSSQPSTATKTYLIGDSVAEGGKSSLEGSVPGIVMNTKVSRSLTEGSGELNGLTVLANDKASYSDAGSVIIELGTNSSGLNGENIQKAVTTVRQNNASAKIYWVNIGNSSKNVDELNNIISSISSAGYTVIDWASQVKQHPEYVGDLGVHLTDSGKTAFAGIIASGISTVAQGASADNASSAACCPAGASNLVGADNPEKVWNFFIGKGLTPPQVAGIMGNMKRESGFNPQRVQSTPTPQGDSPDPIAAGSRGWGLIQWTPGSKALNAAAQAGIAGPIHELATQLELVWGHLNNKPPITTGKFDINFFKTIADVNQAVAYFETHIEGAGVKALEQRNQFAQEFMSQFGSGSSTGSVTSSGGGCSGSGAVAGSIVQTAVNFSWPQNQGLAPKPEYAAAIAQVNPTAPYRGADCGSFVGAVMISSGADPEYPKQQTKAQENYVRAHPEKYDIAENVRLEDLMPGDVLIVNRGSGQNSDGHTLIFVGNQPPNNLPAASASGGKRMPNLGNVPVRNGIVADERGAYIRVRLK